MRIISGELKGRRIKVRPGSAVRPTTDRAREALFNILAPRVPGCRFLDLYAGTGVVGLEALSRGAAQAIFVEKDRRAAALLRDNLARIGVSALATVRRGSAVPVIAALGLEGRKFDLVFMDPPYAGGLADKTLEALARAEVVDPGGWVITETSHRNPPAEQIAGFGVWRRQRYGEALLSFYRLERELT